ncbi:trichoplein keratin filament-binding protein isoform X2 [Dunckerocampus dactyliophorus]|uniref:trichoplein keratin filament-binding protein isoform X2 n=1 Tax=Dunckerocampus dactyliophorus TaxID=161453 RepID=UPI0024065BCE|nr:trichoplein keratin filament-binding protein isoform X2 [Dunckerocampus dactyliophorus]
MDVCFMLLQYLFNECICRTMALPTLTTYIPYRKQTLGAKLAWRREQKFRTQEQLELYAKYYRDQGVRNQLHSHWTSRHSFAQSMSAYCKKRLEEDKINNLEERRIRLRLMLEEEHKQLQAELTELENMETVRSISKEERRKKLAQELLKEHWKSNKPESQQQEVAAQEDMQDKYERTQRQSLERIEQEEENRKDQESQRAEDLRKKMEELRLKEEEATRLRKEEETLLVQQWDLDKIEAERRKIEERRKKAEMRHFLIRQYRSQLRRRSQQVQEELEADHKLIAALLEGEQQEEVEAPRRERVFADAAWMKRVIEEQLQLEREREAEFDLLYREEAQHVWEKREATWERERKARELLMHEVLAERRKQLGLKMQNNRKAQLESLRSRDELIRELEKQKKLRHQEQEQSHKTAWTKEVEQQLQEQCRIEEEEKENADAHLVQEEALRQEKQWMPNRGCQQKIHRQPRVAWT